MHSPHRLDVRQDAFRLVFVHGPCFHVLADLHPQRVHLHAFLVETQQDRFCVQLSAMEGPTFPTNGWRPGVVNTCVEADGVDTIVARWG